MRLVHLLIHHASNNPGEFCAFDDAEAARLISEKKALPAKLINGKPVIETPPKPFDPSALPVESLSIRRFRGIESCDIHGLTGVTILVGKSGSGKSTLLEALLLSESENAGYSIRSLIRRRRGLRVASPWLFYRKDTSSPVTIRTASANRQRTCILAALNESHGGGESWSLDLELKTIDDEDESTTQRWTAQAHLDITDRALTERVEPKLQTPSAPGRRETFVRFLDSRLSSLNEPIELVYGRALTFGLSNLEERVIPLVPGLKRIDSPADDTGRSVLTMVFGDRSVPVALAGDGIAALLRIAIELAAVKRGLVLIEEPETHQHPGAIQQSARALASAAARGIQVVMTTHSLDVIDSMVDALTELQALELLSVVRVALDANGVASLSQFSGPTVLVARNEIHEDLR